MNEHGWQRDERINERDKQPTERTENNGLYDAYGEPVSDEVWKKRLEQEDE